MLIDSCASGGRRNDLETMRRAVPLLRSDYQSFQGDPSFATGNQGHAYGLSFWLPYFGTGTYYNDEQLFYNVRSHMGPAFGFCADVRGEGIDWAKFRRVADQWRRIAPCYLGDFYPLTPHSLAEDVWIAWQFDRPDLGEGMVQVFRRAASIYESARLQLHGLPPDARYTLTNLDAPGKLEMTGRQLAREGLPVTVSDRPGAVILTYRRSTGGLPDKGLVMEPGSRKSPSQSGGGADG
jgi:alpha-galactosidase